MFHNLPCLSFQYLLWKVIHTHQTPDQPSLMAFLISNIFLAKTWCLVNIAIFDLTKKYHLLQQQRHQKEDVSVHVLFRTAELLIFDCRKCFCQDKQNRVVLNQAGCLNISQRSICFSWKDKVNFQTCHWYLQFVQF